MREMSAPLFSVVVPSLNSPVVHKTIEALEHQSLDRRLFEVIVVGMDQLGLVRSGELVRFVDVGRPLSPAANRNHGITLARGDIVVFTDADCIPAPDWLAVLEACFRDPQVTVVGGGVVFETDNYWTLSDNLSAFHDYLASLPPGERRLLVSLNLALRRQLLLEVNRFDERYPYPAGEDSDLSIRLRRLGHHLRFEPRAVVKHMPLRHSFTDLLRHGYYQGKYSVKIDPRYADTEGLPRLLRTRWGVLVGAPFLAAGVVARMLISGPSVWRFWYTMPAIYLAKLAWCVGASRYPG